MLVLVAGAVLMTACARTGQSALPALSTSGRYDNAPILAEFVRRACVDASADSKHVAQILDDIGWKRREIASGQDQDALRMWQYQHVALVRAVTPVDDREDNVWSCQVEIDGSVAPGINRMETALRHGVGNRRVFGSQPGDWHWKPSIFTEGHISLARGRTGPDSLAVSVDYADLKPLKALVGK